MRSNRDAVVPVCERPERLAARAHELRRVGPGREGELDPDPVHRGEPVIEKTDSQMGHPDLVDVGKNEEDVEAPLDGIRRSRGSARRPRTATAAGRAGGSPWP